MTTPISWLELQREIAQRNCEAAKQEFEAAQKRLEETKRRVEACSELLALAREEQELSRKEKAAATGRRVAITPRRTIPDDIESLLEERGPLRPSEIYEWLKHQPNRQGTTKNSINTQLNRLKGERFNKNGEGRWFLVNQEDKEVTP